MFFDKSQKWPFGVVQITQSGLSIILKLKHAIFMIFYTQYNASLSSHLLVFDEN